MKNSIKIATAIIIAACFAGGMPLAASQGSQLPPDSGQAIHEANAAMEDADDIIVGADSTGLAPTAATLRANSVSASVAELLDEYKALLASGAIAQINLDNVPLEDIEVLGEGPVPTKSYYHTSSFLDLDMDVPETEDPTGGGGGTCDAGDTDGSTDGSTDGRTDGSSAATKTGTNGGMKYEGNVQVECSSTSSGASSTSSNEETPLPADALGDQAVLLAEEARNSVQQLDMDPMRVRSVPADQYAPGNQSVNTTPGWPQDPAMDWLRVAGSSASTTVFEDDFNDGSIDSSKWSTSGMSESGDCGYTSSSRALKFGGSAGRTASTRSLDVSAGDKISALTINSP